MKKTKKAKKPKRLKNKARKVAQTPKKPEYTQNKPEKLEQQNQENFENQPFFRSVGLLEGVYLPSSEDLAQGTLMTDLGLFPATLEPQIIKPFKRYKPSIAKKWFFICWVHGISEPPYYRLTMRQKRGQRDFPPNIPHPNWFISQGLVTECTPEKVILKVQLNPKPERPERTVEEIEASVNYLEIRGCPSKVEKSQFWRFITVFKDGFLHCQTAELLADAETNKKLLNV